jgi:hypothetical protein
MKKSKQVAPLLTQFPSTSSRLVLRAFMPHATGLYKFIVITSRYFCDYMGGEFKPHGGKDSDGNWITCRLCASSIIRSDDDYTMNVPQQLRQAPYCTHCIQRITDGKRDLYALCQHCGCIKAIVRNRPGYAYFGSCVSFMPLNSDYEDSAFGLLSPLSFFPFNLKYLYFSDYS